MFAPTNLWVMAELGAENVHKMEPLPGLAVQLLRSSYNAEGSEVFKPA
jgi:hypothetical protein